jgi:hypothetical protein
MSVARASGPWGRTDRGLWVASTAVGTAMSLTGWWMTSGRADLADQVSPATLCVGGALLVLAGHAAWVLRGRRAIGLRSAGLFPEPRPAATDAAPMVAARSLNADRFVAGDGLVHYHRAGCRLAAGRAWAAAPRTEHEQAGQRPCGACRP